MDPAGKDASGGPLAHHPLYQLRKRNDRGKRAAGAGRQSAGDAG